MKDYYYILGVTKDAEDTDIKRAYRKLCIKFHPDKNQGDTFFEQRFKDIAEAYEVLVDPDRRAEYDEALATNEYIFDSEAGSTAFGRKGRKKRRKVTVVVSSTSILIMFLMLTMSGFFDKGPQTGVTGASMTATTATPIEEQPIAKDPEGMFSNKARTEQWILTKLNMYTPDEIRERPAGVLWWDTTSGHIEKNYSYRLKDEFLVISYTTVYKSKEPISNKVIIPIADIDRVYLRGRKLFISTQKPAIIDDNLSMKYTMTSSVFSVGFEGDQEIMLAQNMQSAFNSLKQHYRSSAKDTTH